MAFFITAAIMFSVVIVIAVIVSEAESMQAMQNVYRTHRQQDNKKKKTRKQVKNNTFEQYLENEQWSYINDVDWISIYRIFNL